MTSFSTAVVPLAQHLPGWLLLAAFVALVCVSTSIATHAPSVRPPAADEPERDPDYCYICGGKCGSKAHR